MTLISHLSKYSTEVRTSLQLKMKQNGGFDTKELQHGAQPWDWCFVGAPDDNVHTPDEIVDKRDITSMLALYQVLMREL